MSLSAPTGYLFSKFKQDLDSIFQKLEDCLYHASGMKARIIKPRELGFAVSKFLKDKPDKSLVSYVQERLTNLKLELVTSERFTVFREFQLECFEWFASAAWLEASDERNKRYHVLIAFERLLTCLFLMYPDDKQKFGTNTLLCKWEICARAQASLVREAYGGGAPFRLEGEIERLARSVNAEPLDETQESLLGLFVVHMFVE
jgi:hypothetical protein